MVPQTGTSLAARGSMIGPWLLFLHILGAMAWVGGGLTTSLIDQTVGDAARRQRAAAPLGNDLRSRRGGTAARGLGYDRQARALS
jgi:hypothetical protein